MSNLAIAHSLDLIDRLKEILADFAAREETLARGLQSRRNAISRKGGAGAGEEELAAKLAETGAAFEAEERRLKKVTDARRARIERYRMLTLHSLPQQARAAREGWLGDLQMRLRKAEQRRAGDLHAAAAAFGEFSDRLTVEHQHLYALQKKTRDSLSGYRFPEPAEPPATPDPALDGEGLFAELQHDLAAAGEALQAFRRFLLPQLFRFAPLALLLPLSLIGAAVLAWRYDFSPDGWMRAGGLAVLLAGATLLLYFLGRNQSKDAAHALIAASTRAAEAYNACHTAAANRHEQECREIEESFEQTKAEISAHWDHAPEVEQKHRTDAQEKLEIRTKHLLSKVARASRNRLERLAARKARYLGEIEQAARATHALAATEREAGLAQLAEHEATSWEALQTTWREAAEPIFQQIAALHTEAEARFPAWDERSAESWTPSLRFPADLKFAHLDVEPARLTPKLPQDPRLALPGPAPFALPLALTFPQQGSLLLETKESGDATVIGAINNVILRLLAAAPPGKIAFTLVDPVGLGQNFAGLMHLADYEESLIHRRIWTQQNQIEERLAELNEHIEKVIQMYLRNEYATITEYNAQAGSVAEKYHFLVVADFPAGFSETAARRLQSIATSGPRCGVFTLLHWDRRRPLPEGLVVEDLRKNSVVLRGERGQFFLEKQAPDSGVTLRLDAPPTAEIAAALVHRIGEGSLESSRVEVPFAQIAPPPEDYWKGETAGELRVPIGRTGATKLQYLAIGKGTRQHALLAGKTGSGKSTLFHVIITNLALWCSPDQVEFYLIDFKKGVEFKCYAERRLPHARVIAIESDREFALSVLQRVDEELRRRGDLFRKLGVQDIAGYQRAGAAGRAGHTHEPMPRTLLIIDEFQEFFVEDDAIAQNASLLFDRIVRQGRAFGIHVLLGSQTLGGAYTLARATLGQMVIRIALQCNEADAYLIMDENNAAPRLLSRPGEGIYNDSAGAAEGNSPFQVVWLPDEERDRWIGKVLDTAARQEARYPSPIVFEGNAPAHVAENDLLQRLLASDPLGEPAAARCWLGAPNAIKGPTEALFHRQSGHNLLLVGQREEAALTMLGLSLLALAAQYPPGRVRCLFFQSAPPGSAEAAFIEQIADALPGSIKIIPVAETREGLETIATELKQRIADEEASRHLPPWFIFIHGLQKFKKLRSEDDFSFSMSEDTPASPGAQFNELMTEGAAHGLHLLASVDTLNSVNRFINRKALSEWQMRVVFQMSANDSASLIDAPQASNLGLHRALFYSEHEGALETFRPYALPDEAWLAKALTRLTRGQTPAPGSGASTPPAHDAASS